MDMKLECVITGMGLVLPCGTGIEAARASWESRQPCFRPLPPTLGAGLGAYCEVTTAGIIPSLQNRRLDRASRFAWLAAHQAFQDANLDPHELSSRMGLAVGTMTGGIEASEKFLYPYLAEGPSGSSPLIFPNSVPVAISGHLSIAFGLKGPSITLLAREASFFTALDQAMRWLRLGMVEAMVVVGADGLSPILTKLLQGSRLSTRHNLPEVGSGHGMLPGEGAQVFIVETQDHARARGARIRATIRGLATCAPATPDLNARSLALAEAATSITPFTPTAWISGANGYPILDGVEQHLLSIHDQWPKPQYPKMLWGEFAGSGGSLLAAALVNRAPTALITAPVSFGGQWGGVVILE
jgi:3-oxoacyl-[acyl-carrier-protein] synthase II